MFNRKFSSSIRLKRRMIRSIIILLVVCLGLGYSAFTTNLGINGTLEVSKYDQTLYGVLEKAVSKGYAREYTGEHQDSMAGVGTKKIYHWYAPQIAGDTLSTEILDKNNVIFADHCWQMIRTTDTGGVKMIYNGEPVNNQCLNTRGTHVGYGSATTTSLSETYYYSPNYIYDNINNVFNLINPTTGTIQTGQYTCKGSSAADSCSTLYLVDSLSNGTTYNVLTLNSNSHYSQFGTLQFNPKYNSSAYVGYMYNTVYDTNNISYTYRYMNVTTFTLNPNCYYSDTIDYGNINANQYTLINPQLISSLSDTSDLVGKFVLGYGTPAISNYMAYYVAAVDGTTAHLYSLSSGNLATTMVVGDSYTNNGNGTYTINNPTVITYAEWYNGEYKNIQEKYMCIGSSNTCSTLHHLISSAAQGYYYSWNSNNSYKFGENLSYISGTYTLTGDVKEVWDFSSASDRNIVSSHRYTCLSNMVNCTDAKYVPYLNTSKLCWSELDGETNISEVINKTLFDDNVNQINSTMKTGIDAWYKRYMTEYTSKLEDTIFCNDRNILNLGGWDPNNGNIGTHLQFNSYNFNNNSLNCTNITDKFSLNNNKAKLTYPVGLITFPETYLFGNQIIRTTGKAYYSISPYGVTAGESREYTVPQSGGFGADAPTNSRGVRPVISLKPGTEYVSGTGSMADPYVVQ